MEMCLQGKGVINLSFLATQKAVTQQLLLLPWFTENQHETAAPHQAEAFSETQAL